MNDVLTQGVREVDRGSRAIHPRVYCLQSQKKKNPHGNMGRSSALLSAIAAVARFPWSAPGPASLQPAPARAPPHPLYTCPARPHSPLARVFTSTSTATLTSTALTLLTYIYPQCGMVPAFSGCPSLSRERGATGCCPCHRPQTALSSPSLQNVTAPANCRAIHPAIARTSFLAIFLPTTSNLSPSTAASPTPSPAPAHAHLTRGHTPHFLLSVRRSRAQ